MTFEQLLKDPLLQTPKVSIYENDFFDYVESNLYKFRDKIYSLQHEKIKIPGIKYNPPFIKKISNTLINGLLNCLRFYLAGEINDAYNELDRTLTHESKNFYGLIKQQDISKQSDFYRIRIRTDNILFSPEQMFHVPFESRGHVRNQRYSINGFPSLYVSSNLYTCWEELNKPNINEFQAVRLQNTKDLKIIDLTPSPFQEVFEKANYRYIITWPIIFCCSIKVKNSNDIFKPEYIIPQLLLQWVRRNDKIDGIRYFSTNIDLHNSLSKGDFSNYVFPVKKNNKKGYCTRLSQLFDITNSISWQTYQYAIGGQTFDETFGNSENIKQTISKLEIIKGMSYPYSYSIFSQLEKYLGYMKLNKIKI